MQQLQQLYAFIGTVPESRMRLILTLRFAAGMDWRQVAKTLNDDSTADTAQKDLPPLSGKHGMNGYSGSFNTILQRMYATAKKATFRNTASSGNRVQFLDAFTRVNIMKHD